MRISSASLHAFQQFIDELSRQGDFITVLAELKKNLDINANLILYAIWFARAEQGRLSKLYLKSLFNTVHAWHNQVTVSLMELVKTTSRARLSQGAQIKKMLEIELQQADRVEHRLLADTQVPLKVTHRHDLQKLSDACFNLLNYFKLMQIPLRESIFSLLVQILHAAFADIPSAEITRIFKLVLENSKAHPKNPEQLRLKNI